MDLSNICTFIMPFRIESSERQRNLSFAVGRLTSTNSKILLLEADVSPKVSKTFFSENVEYIFIKDSCPVFHRTRYINMLMKRAATEVVAVWDTDIVTSYTQIAEATKYIQAGCTIAYPYSGEYVMLSPECTEEFTRNGDLTWLESLKLDSVFNRPFCGGAFFVNREQYLSLGGENEHFIGWGPEDAERLRRIKIMEHQVRWTTEGKAYHLYHPRKDNSCFFGENAAIEMRKELVKVCSMNKEELSEYIKTFSCRT